MCRFCVVKPKCGKMNFYHLLKTVYGFLEQQDQNDKKNITRKTDFFTALDFIRRYFDKPCFIPVVSDFVGFDKILSSRIFRMLASRHEFIFIFLDEPEMYDASRGFGYLKVKDIETGQIKSVSRRKIDGKEIRLERTELRRELRKMGVQSVVLEYGKHFKRLRRFFMARRKYIRS